MERLWCNRMLESSGTLSYVGGEEGIRSTFRAPYLVLLMVANRLEVGSVRLSLSEVTRVNVGRGEALVHSRTHNGVEAEMHIEVPDGWMSTRHLTLQCEPAGWVVRDAGSKNGCYHNGKRCGEAALVDGDLIGCGNASFLFRSDVERSHLDPADVSSLQLRSQPTASQTLSLPLSHLMSELAQVATSQVSVILGGETGTGKEVSARYVHKCSGRKGSFVAVNCGALPATLIESELFGHRKGAFSGANTDRVGIVQTSDGGTLFLDEVAELPLEAQVKLLRCLQEREVVPVGATRPVPVDLRVVAATHADLPALVQSGDFRADLYARLAGVSFRLPELRERREDLGLLVDALLKRCAGEQTLHLEREAVWAMAMYGWPLNIRELEQALVAGAAWSERGVIGLRHLPPSVRAVLQPEEAVEQDALKVELVTALRKHAGNVSATAREMGKARVQIRRWCKRYELDPAHFR
ncbi:MAG: FHA domain-containing protein [Myxococcales bacterium]|nr:FHA domain-containing protein [Myxococcales bacterium]